MSNWPSEGVLPLPLAASLIKAFEGCRLKPYKDSAGVPTIGYGTIQYPSGTAVTMKDKPISKDDAEYLLMFEMSKKAEAIAPAVRRPTLHQAAAMLSLAYNIGSGAFKTSSVLRKFNEGDFPGAADAFLMWDKATVDGKLVPVPGLHNRRAAERDFFLTSDEEVSPEV